MGFKATDLRPSKVVMNICDKDITLNFVSLEMDVFYTEKYGSINKTLDHIRENPLSIFEVIYPLVEDKKQFKTLKEFRSFCTKIHLGSSLEDRAILIFEKIQEVFQKSSPIIKNYKRMKEHADIKKAQDDKEICYGEYFDTLHGRYGYSLDEFYQLTLRQIHILLKVASDRNYDELRTQASMHGRKMEERMQYADITEEEEEEQDRHAMEALEMLKQRFNEQQGNAVNE